MHTNILRLECSDNKSNKFWEGTVTGNELTIRWGKIGTSGQSKMEIYGSERAALMDLGKKATSKIKGSYSIASNSTIPLPVIDEALSKVQKGVTSKTVTISKKILKLIEETEKQIVFDNEDSTSEETDSLSAFDYMSRLVQSPLFALRVSTLVELGQEPYGVIGGKGFSSHLSDPVLCGELNLVAQLNLSKISKGHKLDIGQGILEVWLNEKVWGQGVDAFCRVIPTADTEFSPCYALGNGSNIDEGHHVEYNKGCAGLGWRLSRYFEKLMVLPPLYITALDAAGFNIPEVGVIEAIEELGGDFSEVHDDYEWEDNEEYFEDELSTCFGRSSCSNHEALLCEDDPFSWLPLFNMNGPLSSGDPVEDELTVFYRNKGDGDFEYKVKAHRWSF